MRKLSLALVAVGFVGNDADADLGTLWIFDEVFGVAHGASVQERPGKCKQEFTGISVFGRKLSIFLRKTGSRGRTRTYNHTVNSRVLYH